MPKQFLSKRSKIRPVCNTSNLKQKQYAMQRLKSRPAPPVHFKIQLGEPGAFSLRPLQFAREWLLHGKGVPFYFAEGRTIQIPKPTQASVREEPYFRTAFSRQQALSRVLRGQIRANAPRAQ